MQAMARLSNILIVITMTYWKVIWGLDIVNLNRNCDIVLVTDASSKLSEKQFNILKEFSKNVIKKSFRRGNRYGIISYAENARVEIPLASYSSLDKLNQNINNIAQRGWEQHPDKGFYLAHQVIVATTNYFKDKSRNQVVFLINSHMQHSNVNSISMESMSKNLRQFNVKTNLISIGLQRYENDTSHKYHSDEIFTFDNYEDLLDRNVIDMFSSSCQSVSKTNGKQKYFLNLQLINLKSITCDVKIKNGLKDAVYNFFPNSKRILKFQRFAFEPPNVEVTYNCTKNPEKYEENKVTTVLDYESFKEAFSVARISQNGISTIPVYQINLLITNLLQKDITLNWKVNKRSYHLKVPADSSKNNFVVNIFNMFETPEEVIFFVRYKKSNEVLINGHRRIIVQLIEPFKQLFLFISNRDTPIVGNFSFSYTAFNMASEDIFLQLSNHDGHELKSIVRNTYVSSVQQPVSMLAITENDFAIVRSFLPHINASNTILFIGSFFVRKVPFGFYLHLVNLEKFVAYIRIRVLNHEYAEKLNPLSSSKFYVQFSFVEIIPAIEVSSINSMYVNNRLIEFLLTENQDEVIKIVCSKEKAIKSFVYADIRNDAQQMVELHWKINSSSVNHLFHPIPTNTLTLQKNTQKKHKFVFYSHKPLPNILFEVRGRNGKESISINDKAFYSAETKPTLPEFAESFLIRTEGKLYYVRINAINNLLNDVVLKWKFDNNNGQVIPKSASKFIISGRNRQLISVKFKKVRRHASGNDKNRNVERIQFSALDVESHKKLFVNSLHFFSVNATDSQLDPVDLIIKNPSYQYFFVFEAINQLATNVYLKWNVQNDTGNIMETEYPQHKEFFVRPLTKELYSVQFTSKESLSEDQLRQVLVFQATNSNKDHVLINETIRYFVDLSKPKEKAVVLVLSITESYRRIEDLEVVRIKGGSVMIRWEIPKRKYDFSIQWWQNKDLNVQKVIIKSEKLQTDNKYFYYTVRNLIAGKYYFFNVKKNIELTQDALLKVHVENYKSPSIISVKVKNELNENVHLIWWTSDITDTRMFTLSRLTNIETFLLFKKENLPQKVFIQLVEEESKLLLLFEDGRDIFEISPQDYEKELHLDIPKDQMIKVKQDYFAHLSFTNLALSYANVIVKDSKGNILHQQFIAPGSSNINNIILKQLVSIFPMPYYVIAKTGRGNLLALNRKFKLSIYPMLHKLEIPIFIADIELAEDLPQNYFLDVLTINQWENPINFVLFTNGKINRFNIPPSQSYRLIEIENADESPPLILGKIIDEKTENHLRHHNKSEISLNFQDQYHPIRIIVSEKGSVRIEHVYFIEIEIINKRKEKSYLKFNRKIETLTVNEKIQERFFMYVENKPKPLLLSAFNLEENVLHVNRKMFVAIQPSALSTHQEIEITDIPVETYQVQLKFINLASDTIHVLISVNSKTKLVPVASKSLYVHDMEVTKGRSIKVNAFYPGSENQAQLNNSKEYRKILNKNIKELFYLEASGNQLDASLVPYFYHFTIQNLNPEDVIVRWSEIEKDKNLIVRSGEKETYWQVMLGINQPPDIHLHFYGSRYQDLLFINGERNMVVSPSMFAHQTSITLDVGTTIRIYFAKLYFINTLQYEVKIKNNQNKEVLKIPSQSSIKQNFQKTATRPPKSILINAFVNNENLFVNGENEGSKIRLSREPETKYLFIGVQESSSIDQLLLKVIEIKLTIFNKRLLPIQVEIYHNYGLLHKILIRANSTEIFERTLTDTGDDSIIVVRYVDAIEKKYLSANGVIDVVLKWKHSESVVYEIKNNIQVDESWKKEPSVYLIRANINNEYRKNINVFIKNKFSVIKKLQIKHYKPTEYLLIFPLRDSNELSVHGMLEGSGQKVRINGHEIYKISASNYCCMENPLNNNVQFVMNLHIGREGLHVFTKKTINVQNYHSTEVNMKWQFNKHRGNVVIKPGQSIGFLLSHKLSRFVPEISMEAFDGKRNILINNQPTVAVKFNDKNATLLKIGDKRNQEDLVAVEFINSEFERVILKRTMMNGVSVQLSHLELANEEKKRVYFSFPQGVYLYSLTAHFEYSNKLISINNKYSWQFSKYSPSFSQLNIQQYRASNILLRYEIDCNNRYHGNAVISWNENGYLRNQKIKSGERILIRGEVSANQIEEKLTFNAESESVNLAMNGLDRFEIIVSERDHIYFVIISDKYNVNKKSIPPGLTLRVVNHLSDDVNIFWHWPTIGGYVATVSGSSERLLFNICDDLEAIESISFTGVSLSNRKVKLNGKHILRLSTDKRESIDVHIESPNHVMVSENLNLALINTYPLPVNIDWRANDGVKGFFTMLPGERALVSDHVRRKTYGEKTIAFQAWDMANKNNVLLNNRKLLNILLLENNIDRNNFTNIVITKDNATTFFTLFIINKYAQDIRFTWKAFVSTEEKGIISITGEIPIPKTQKYYKWFQYFVRKPLYIEFRSYNVNNGKQLYMNGMKSFNLTGQSSVPKDKIYKHNYVTSSSYNDAITYGNDGMKFKYELIVGEPVHIQKYIVNLVVTNLLRFPVGVRWKIGSKHSWNVLRSFQFNHVINIEIAADELPPKIPFFSIDLPTRQSILTNDVEKYWVQPLPKKQLTYRYVFISKKKTLREHFFHFKNPTNESIHVKWRTLARNGKFIVPKHQSNYTVSLNISGGYRIQSIRMVAYLDTHEEMMLNSNRKLFARIPHQKVIRLDYYYRVFTFNNTYNETLSLTATFKKHSQLIPPLTSVKIKILAKDIANKTITFTAAKLRSQLMVPISGHTLVKIHGGQNNPSIFQIGEKIDNELYFSLKFFLVNDHKHHVQLKWKHANNITSIFTVPIDFNEEISLFFKTPMPVFFSAFDGITKQPIYMNKKDRLSFVPSKNVEYADSIVFDGEISLYDYFYQLSIDNFNENEMTVSLENDNETLVVDVPPSYRNFTISTPLMDLKSGLRKPMRVYVTEKKSNKPYKINGVDFYTIYPTLEPTDVNKIVTGVEELPASSYQYSLSITVSEETPNTILKYKFQHKEKSSRIPKWAKDYKLVLPLKSYRVPPNITFQAFIEGTDSSLFINGELTGTMTPFYDVSKFQTIVISKATHQSVSGPSLNYDFPLFVSNPNSDAIELKMTNLYNKDTVRIPAQAKRFLVPMFLNDDSTISPYTFQAYLNGSRLKINGVTSFTVLDYRTDFLRIEKIAVTKLFVVNTLPVIVFLQQISENLDKIDEIHPQKPQTLQFYILHSQGVKLSAFAPGGRNLSINNNSFIIVRESTENSIQIVIRILTLYYSLNFRNMELYDVEIKWSHANNANSHVIKGRNTWSLFFENNELDMSSYETYFTAERVWRGKPIYINNRDVFSIKPDLDKHRHTKVLLSDEPTNLQTFLYIDLDVTNLLDNDVLLKWDRNESKLIPRNIYHMSLVIAIPQPFQQSRYVTIRAFPNDYTEIPIILNNQRSLHFVAHKKKLKKSVIISSLMSEHKTYNLHLTIQNHHLHAALVQYRQMGTKLSYAMHVPPKYHRVFNLVFIQHKNKPVSVLFGAYDAVKLNKIKINNADGVQYQPRQSEESMLIHVGSTVPQLSANDISQEQVIRKIFPYFLGLQVVNHIKSDVTLYWRATNSLDDANALTVPAGRSRDFSKLLMGTWQAPWIAISASTQQNRRISVNGKNIYYIQASLARNVQFIHLHMPEQIQHSSNARFISLKANNMAPFQVLLQWVEGEFPKSLLIKENSRKYYSTIFNLSKNISSLLIQGFDYEALVDRYDYSIRRPVFLNGRSELRIFPSSRFEVKHIRITDRAIEERRYHFGFIVYNLLNDSVILHYQWNDNSRKIIRVLSHGVKSIESIVRNKINITVHAYNARTKQSVLMNGEEYINILASKIRGKHVILIGKPAVKKNDAQSYSLTLQIINRNDKSFVLSWLQNTVLKKLVIPSFNVTNYVVRVKAFDQPSPIRFSVNEKLSSQAALINGESELILQPRANGYFAHLEITYEDLFRPGEILSGEEATANLCEDKLDVLFLLDSSGSMKRVFPFAKQFITMLSETFHYSSNTTQVGLIDFSEEALVQIPLNRYNDHRSFSADVNSLPFIGYRTRLDLALKQASDVFHSTKYGARKDASKLLFLLTDGRTTKERLLFRSLMNSLFVKLKDVKIVTIALSGARAPDRVLLSYVTNSNTIYQIDNEADLLSAPFLNGLIFKYCKMWT